MKSDIYPGKDKFGLFGSVARMLDSLRLYGLVIKIGTLDCSVKIPCPEQELDSLGVPRDKLP